MQLQRFIRFVGGALTTSTLLLASSGPIAALPARAQSDTASTSVDPCQPPYDDLSTACALNGSGDTFGILTTPGTSNIYALDVPATGAHVRVELTELPADYDLYLLDAATQVVAQSVQDGLTPESVDADLTDAGRYYIYVAVDGTRLADPDAAYHLHVVKTDYVPTAAAPAVLAPTATPPAVAPVVTLVPSPTTVPVPAAPPTLNVSPAQFQWPRSATISWDNIPTTTDAWFTLFRADDISSRSTALNLSNDTFAYVSCLRTPVAPHPSGSCTVPVNPAQLVETTGPSEKFEFRMYSSQSNPTLVARSNTITIAKGSSAVGVSGTTLSVSPTALTSKQSVTVTWANIPDATQYAWFGLFRPDDQARSTAFNLNYPTWYVSCLSDPVAPHASGSCSVTLDAANFVSPAGQPVVTEFRLYSDMETGTLLARSNPFTVTPPKN